MFRKKPFRKLIQLWIFILCISCTAQESEYPSDYPKHYICYQANRLVKIDGDLNEPDWALAKWSDDFEDIIGVEMNTPFYTTKTKMLWDEKHLYIAAELEEEHIYSTIKKRDAQLYKENAFEVFIDPDGDRHQYIELEINAQNTIWDLKMSRPYEDGGKANSALDMQYLQTAIKLVGSLNNAKDKDKKWIVEMAIAWKDLEMLKPISGEQWRMNFARVQWLYTVEENMYKKQDEVHYWTWTPQKRLNMHLPEHWGFVQFSEHKVGKKEEPFKIDEDYNLKLVLMEVYEQQKKYFKKKKIFSNNIEDLPLSKKSKNVLKDKLKISATKNSFTLQATGKKDTWQLNHLGHLTIVNSN